MTSPTPNSTAKMVHPGLFVGNGFSIYKFSGSILHCARDPWFTDAFKNLCSHRSFENYGLITIDNNLVARTGHDEMALNMVDADDPRYFKDAMINAGLQFITDRFANGDSVLVHCNAGMSRSPSMAFLWMFEHGFLDEDFQGALAQFKDLYPGYCPGNGIQQYLKNRCDAARLPSFESQGPGKG